jgi:hypothetical protein
MAAGRVLLVSHQPIGIRGSRHREKWPVGVDRDPIGNRPDTGEKEPVGVDTDPIGNRKADRPIGIDQEHRK